jgi:hypothetical protein
VEPAHLSKVSLRKILTTDQNPVLIARMKTKTAVLTLTFSFLAGAVCFGANPQIGTWKLNEKKSKMTPGTGKNMTVVYQSMLFQTKVTVDGVEANGKATHSEWTGMFDGKDHRVSGNANEETRAYRKIDDRTLEFTSKKGGKVTTTGQIVVAPDGKSRTVTTTGTSEKGKKFKNVAVYDKA